MTFSEHQKTVLTILTNNKIVYIVLILFLFFKCQNVKTSENSVEIIEDSNGKKEVNYFNKADSSFHVKEYYVSGNLKSEYTFKKGKIDGLVIGYFEDGQIAMKKSYSNGLIDGKDEIWYETGELKTRFICESGKRISGGNYYRNGQAIGELTFENGFVIFGKYYYEDGCLRSVGAFKNRQKHGFWKSYYNNGNLKNLGMFQKNKKVGMWQAYDENGNLTDEFIY